MKHKVATTVNGHRHEHEVEPRLLLVHYLRDVVGLTGTHIGCDTSQCGACTILVDGKAVKSCTMFAVQAEGKSLTTIEGMAKDGELHPLQQAFLGRARPSVRLLHPRLHHGRLLPARPRTRTRPRTRSARASKATSAGVRAT